MHIDCASAHEMLTTKAAPARGLHSLDFNAPSRRKQHRMQSMFRYLWGHDYRFEPRFYVAKGENRSFSDVLTEWTIRGTNAEQYS